MAKSIMVQGTMSSAGKSLITAALCRIFAQDGYRVSPFKSQNMALNSFITAEGLEMGRSQVVQAEAAKVAPSVRMNPVLLKPTTDIGSQVIVNGEVRGNMNAAEYFAYKEKLLPEIMSAYESLAAESDIVVLEGAGSPAEINLRDFDLVNMGMAKRAGSPVLLVGDVDRGGVFAQLYGTVALLEPDERDLVKGLVINKFRGDKSILDPGIELLRQKLLPLADIPTVGVVPYARVDIEEEDSLTERFTTGGVKRIDIAVIRLPRISNFTDLSPFERYESVSVRYVDAAANLRHPDMIVIPGTKSTISDLLWMRQNGLEAAIQHEADAGTVIFGICGGYQILGRELRDPLGVEGGGTVRGMGLLPITTVFREEKTRTQTKGIIQGLTGTLAPLCGMSYSGYEIHMGKSEESDVPLMNRGDVYGTYIHGIFDDCGIAPALVNCLCKRKGIEAEDLDHFDPAAYKEQQYDKLADIVRRSMDMARIYDILEAGV